MQISRTKNLTRLYIHSCISLPHFDPRFYFMQFIFMHVVHTILTTGYISILFLQISQAKIKFTQLDNTTYHIFYPRLYFSFNLSSCKLLLIFISLYTQDISSCILFSLLHTFLNAPSLIVLCYTDKNDPLSKILSIPDVKNITNRIW